MRRYLMILARTLIIVKRYFVGRKENLHKRLKQYLLAQTNKDFAPQRVGAMISYIYPNYYGK